MIVPHGVQTVADVRVRWRRWRSLWAVVVVGVLIGGGVLYIARYPQLAVTADVPLHPLAPFTTPFTITNVGPWAMYDVSRSCYVHEATYQRTGHVSAYTTTADGRLAELGPRGASTTVRCWAAIGTSDSRYGDQLLDADASVFVAYRLRLWPFRLTMHRRFRTERRADGLLRWRPRTENGL